MAEFLTTTGTSHHIEQIIIESKEKLILVSPYLKLSKTLFERLKDACLKNIPITIIYGKDELNPNQKDSLAELTTLKLLFFQNLHAKCYLNEKRMVITSMNMYEFSEKNNREMGILVDKIDDEILYNKALSEVQSIIQSAELIPNKKTQRQTAVLTNKDSGKSNPKSTSSTRGYCIRCETRIPLNPDKPLCTECYSSWAKYENMDYEENVCHSCGEYEDSSVAKPLCYKCYKKQKDSELNFNK